MGKETKSKEKEFEDKEYLEYIASSSPKTPMIKTMVLAFIVGGIICMIGEGLRDMYSALLPHWGEEDLGGLTTMTLIFLGSFFTAIGIYDKIGGFAGAGSIIPITGFANSIVSPAMEYNREGVIFGICSRMFIIAGPIVVIGVCASVLAGIVGLWL